MHYPKAWMVPRVHLTGQPFVGSRLLVLNGKIDVAAFPVARKRHYLGSYLRIQLCYEGCHMKMIGFMESKHLPCH